MKHLFQLTLFISLISACSTTPPVIPESKNMEVSRKKPGSDCKEIGKVTGTTLSKTGTIESAIEDMKLDAARKGANYVQMGTTSAYGKNVEGIAYLCE